MLPGAAESAARGVSLICCRQQRSRGKHWTRRHWRRAWRHALNSLCCLLSCHFNLVTKSEQGFLNKP